MEITRKDILTSIDQFLKTHNITPIEEIDLEQVTSTVFHTDAKSMSFVSTGDIGILMIITLPTTNVKCCVIKTRHTCYQISIAADIKYFKGTIFYCIVDCAAETMICKLEIFDIVMLAGKSQRQEEYARRFEYLLESINSTKFKTNKDNTKIMFYRHRNSDFTVNIDIMNMFANFGDIQTEYRKRLLQHKNIFGTIFASRDKFEFKQLLV
jgi:hypothetical protein